jgi:hypothetical protein
MEAHALRRLARLRASTARRMVEQVQAGHLADGCEDSNPQAVPASVPDPQAFRDAYNAHAMLLAVQELADLIDLITGD